MKLQPPPHLPYPSSHYLFVFPLGSSPTNPNYRAVSDVPRGRGPRRTIRGVTRATQHGGSNRGTFALNTARAAHRIKDREDLAGVVGDPRSRRSATETADERRERGITRGHSTGKTERKGAGGDVSGGGGRTGSRGLG